VSLESLDESSYIFRDTRVSAGSIVYSGNTPIGIVCREKDDEVFTYAEAAKLKTTKPVSNVFWKNQKPATVVYFNQLETGECFKIDTPSSLGAVYRKVVRDKDCTPTYYQEEIATARLFLPTPSPVKRVTVEIHVDESKPSIYVG